MQKLIEKFPELTELMIPYSGETKQDILSELKLDYEDAEDDDEELPFSRELYDAIVDELDMDSPRNPASQSSFLRDLEQFIKKHPHYVIQEGSCIGNKFMVHDPNGDFEYITLHIQCNS